MLTQSQIEARRAQIRALVESAGSTILAVEFTKRETGEHRVMNVQLPAITSRLVGDDAVDSAKRATETRKARHPSLYPVFDVAKRAIRSFDLDRVHAVTVRGVRYDVGEAVAA